MKRYLLVALVSLLSAWPAAAQTLIGDRIRLNTGPCVMRSGSGTPEAAVTGNVCDTWYRTDSGQLYFKVSGTGNTGWITWASTATASALVVRDGSAGINVAALVATQATLSGPGTLSAVTGSFSTSATTPLLLAAANLTFNPTGDLILDPIGNDILPVTNYDLNIGAINLKYLTLHAAELWVETLVAQNTIATIGGRILVAPTTTLTVDLAPAGTTITVKHNQMSNGDRVYMEANGSVEFMAITSSASGSAGAYVYSVTRDLDGSGANQWYAGDAVLNTGTTGKGFLDLYSISGVLSGAGPTMVANVRTGTTYNAISPRMAIGNLNGLYGYGADLYGAAFGDPSGPWLKIDTNNGVRIGYNTTTYTQVDASGNASFASGGVTINPSGIAVVPANSGSGSVLASYKFTTGGTFVLGMSAWDYTGTRGTILEANGENTGKDTAVVLLAANTGGAANQAEIQLLVPGSGTDTQITINAPTISLTAGTVFAVAGTQLFGTYSPGSAFVQTLAGIIDIGQVGTTAQSVMRFFNANNTIGSISVNGTTTSYNTTSDDRLKDNIRVVRQSDVLRDLVIHDFVWKDTKKADRGIFAQEAALVKVDAITPGSDDVDAQGRLLRPWMVDYSKFVPDLIAGWQQHEDRLDAIEAAIKALQ